LHEERRYALRGLAIAQHAFLRLAPLLGRGFGRSIDTATARPVSAAVDPAVHIGGVSRPEERQEQQR